MASWLQSFFRLQPDGPIGGKQVDTAIVANDAAVNVHRQIGGIGDPNTFAAVAAVKLGSTAAGASDPALAVALSPNSPLPAGTNAIGAVTDSNSAPFAGVVAMVVDTPQAPQRSVGVLCTGEGDVEFAFADESTLTLPVEPGWTTFPFACTTIVSAGTTATATYFNLK